LDSHLARAAGDFQGAAAGDPPCGSVRVGAHPLPDDLQPRGATPREGAARGGASGARRERPSVRSRDAGRDHDRGAGGGVDRAMGPCLIPSTDRFIRSVPVTIAEEVARDIRELASAKDVKGYLFERLSQLGVIELIQMYH